MAKQRESNIELLRLVVMAFIVLHHYHKHITRKYDLLLFAGSSTITAILAVVLHRSGIDTYRVFCYNSPFVLISAISLFMLFTKIQYRSNVINYLAASCLPIYLMPMVKFESYTCNMDLHSTFGFGYLYSLFFL